MSFWLPPTCAAPITPLTLMILTHTMVLQAIRRTIWILTAGNNDPPPADPSARPQANQDGPARAWRPEGAANTTHRKKWRVSDKQREENPTCDDGTWAPKMLKSWARRSRLLQLGHARRSKKEGMGGKSRLRPVESSVM